jgi:ABC-type Fe3+ transport system permease subunit
MIIWFLIIALIILAFPVGLLIAWMAKDELKDGRKWFKALIIVSAIIGTILLIIKRYVESLTLLFIIIFTGISLWKSYDKKWTKSN